MSKLFRFALLTILVSASLFGATSTAKAFIPIPPDPITSWVIPTGLPEGVSATEFWLLDTHTFVFNNVTYSPPKEWMLFASSGLNLNGNGAYESAVELCFYYPKAHASVGEWFPTIFRLYDGKWSAFPTTQKIVPGYGEKPFVCTSTTLPGLYIVADYYYCEGICEVDRPVFNGEPT